MQESNQSNNLPKQRTHLDSDETEVDEVPPHLQSSQDDDDDIDDDYDYDDDDRVEDEEYDCGTEEEDFPSYD